MDLRFLTRALQQLCNSRAAMVARWGDDQASAVGHRLHELEGVDCLGDLAELPYLRVAADDADDTFDVTGADGVVVTVLLERVDGQEPDAAWSNCTSITICDVFVNGHRKG
jgi:hypothetical protein